tara:strand:- start:1170 stop:2630 length:1461 start_codon:yes stop_codon:yes gene_type:complete
MEDFDTILIKLSALFSNEAYLDFQKNFEFESLYLKKICSKIIEYIRNYRLEIKKSLSNKYSNCDQQNKKYSLKYLKLLEILSIHKINNFNIYELHNGNNHSNIIFRDTITNFFKLTYDLKYFHDVINVIDARNMYNNYDISFLVKINSDEFKFTNFIKNLITEIDIFMKLVNTFQNKDFIKQIVKFFNEIRLGNTKLFYETKNNIKEQQILKFSFSFENEGNQYQSKNIYYIFNKALNDVNCNIYSIKNIQDLLNKEKFKYSIFIHNELEEYIKSIGNLEIYKKLSKKYDKKLKIPSKLKQKIKSLKLSQEYFEFQLSYLYQNNLGNIYLIPACIYSNINKNYEPLTLNSILNNKAHQSISLFRQKKNNGSIILGDIYESGSMINNYKYSTEPIFFRDTHKILYTSYSSLVIDYNLLPNNLYWNKLSYFHPAIEFITNLFLCQKRHEINKSLPYLPNEIRFIILEMILVKEMCKGYKYKRNTFLKL